MKIIKPSVEFFGEVPTDYENTLRFIETAGRTCYKSEDKITETSAEGFVKKLIKAGHLAMVEHSNFVVRTDFYENTLPTHVSEYALGKYLTVFCKGTFVYVGGNLTAWANHIGMKNMYVDNVFLPFLLSYGELFDLQNVCVAAPIWKPCPRNEIPAALHRYSAKFICDRGVSHELVRHRPCSFAQESTRYVNYGGKDMEFIEPAGFDSWTDSQKSVFKASVLQDSLAYNYLLDTGLSPQQARAVLPNSLKTEIIVTADAAEWAHIKKLRTHPSAHPDMVRVMNMMPWEEMGL